MTDESARDSAAVPEGLLRFVDRFDRREYWLAHEELEEVWLDDRRDCYKGLIHVAAALLHGERGNCGGARTKCESALEYLRNDPDCPGFDGTTLLAQIQRLSGELDRARDRGALARWAAARVPLRPIFLGDVPAGIAETEELPYRVRRHDEGYRTRRDPRRRD